MAANGARRAFQFCSTPRRVNLMRSTTTANSTFASRAASSKLKPTSAASQSSLHKLTFSRLPVELGGALSLMPMHSVTASALFTSLLSLHNNKWGCLSEGFATPL